MKNLKKTLFLILSTLSLSAFGEDSAMPCKSGVEAFKKNVYPLIYGTAQNPGRCVKCHATQGPGPQHSLSDPIQSYLKVKPYVDFLNISKSVFAVKGGNGHCKGYNGGPDCGATQTELEGAIQKWWDEGEKTCALQGAILTSAKSLPANLPSYPNNQFATLAWDLGEIKPALKGVMAFVDVQQYSTKSATTSEAYRFKRPTVFSMDKSVEVKGLRVVVNGVYDPLANGYSSLDVKTSQKMSAPFTLSTRSLIVLADKGAQADKISIAFDEIDFTTPLECKNVSDFDRLLQETYKGCGSCHSVAGNKATQKFDLSGTASQICGQFLLRVNRDFVSQSPLILYGLGHDGHPVNVNAQDFLDKIKNWLKVEAPVNRY